MSKGTEKAAASPKAASGTVPPLLGLELHVTESAPKHLQMRITTACVPANANDDEDGEASPPAPRGRRIVFKVAFGRAKSFLGAISGSDMETVLTYAYAADDKDNLQGIVALVDGGYNNEDQTSPDRTLELITAEKYGMTVGEWRLPREKHERPARIDMITGAIKALLSEK